MKVVLKRELVIEQLYDEIIEGFTNLDACDSIGLTEDDVTHAFMAQVFSELAAQAKCYAVNE